MIILNFYLSRRKIILGLVFVISATVLLIFTFAIPMIKKIDFSEVDPDIFTHAEFTLEELLGENDIILLGDEIENLHLKLQDFYFVQVRIFNVSEGMILPVDLQSMDGVVFNILGVYVEDNQFKVCQRLIFTKKQVTSSIIDCTNGRDLVIDESTRISECEVHLGLGEDFFKGKAAEYKIFGEGDTDFIRGGNKDDLLDGGGGADVILGFGGNDTIQGRSKDDSISGGNGNDKIYGGLGLDYIYGDKDNDQIYGEDGNDYLYGGVGNDFILGGPGNDEIDGGPGIDAIGQGDGIEWNL